MQTIFGWYTATHAGSASAMKSWTSWPNRVKSVAVSITTRPVTVTAEVDVNKASRKLVSLIDSVDLGSKRSPVPTSITNKKLNATI